MNEINKLEIEYFKAQQELKLVEEKHKDMLDIPPGMCDRLVYPREVSEASMKRFKAFIKLYEARKNRRVNASKASKVIERLKAHKT